MAKRCVSTPRLQLLWFACSAAAFTVVLSARPQPPVAQRFQPQGEKVAIPGTDNCFIYVAALENGSWLDPASTEDSPVTRSGTVLATEPSRLDVNDVTRWLQHFLEHSPDMVAKAKAACEATGVNFIQIGIVRDDPQAGPGAWYFDRGPDRWGGTPLVVLDIGDIEKLAKHVESTPMGNEGRERSARQRVAAIVPATLFAHECDHAQRAPYILEQELFFANVGRVANLTPEEIRSGQEFYQKYRDDLEQKAIDDENAVILDLDAFKHTGYSRTAYSDGNGGIPYKIDGVQVRVNAARALGSVEHAGHEHRFVTLDGADLQLLDNTPSAFDRSWKGTASTSAVKPSNPLFVFSPRRLSPLINEAMIPLAEKDRFNSSIALDGSHTTLSDRLLQAIRPSDAANINVILINTAGSSEGNQEAGSTTLSYVDNSVVMAGHFRAPRLQWASKPSPIRASVASRISYQTGGSATGGAMPVVKAIFVATGRSSGAAFQMTMAYDGEAPMELIDPGYVLEPVKGVSAAQAERAIAGEKGRKVSKTIDAYCLQMQKPPPAAGMVYRLARNPVQQRHPQLAPIMVASKILKDTGRLNPDSDPANYFHSIRQWALWTHEQGFRDEAAFTRAFVEHSKKNVTAGGRQWTPELEQNVRRLMPNRWRDISEVMKLAGLGETESR